MRIRKWGGSLSKLVAVLLVSAYLIVISLIHSTPYLWLSLILIVLLCLTLFAYTRDRPLIRWRRASIPNTATSNENEEPQMTEVPAAIWMSDIPPTYSNVMRTANPPVTPPPSYGSALLMFPWMANGQESPDISRLIENARFRSVSRQVSESSGIYNCSVSISRQTSRQDATSTVRQLSTISRQVSQATIYSTQIAAQETKQIMKNCDNPEHNNTNNTSLSVIINVEQVTTTSTMLHHEPKEQLQQHQKGLDITKEDTEKISEE